jgi:cytidine deaminase
MADSDPTPDQPLLAAARQAAENAHAPYSRFRVGAAVRAGGRIHTGGNIENASYGLSICAERVAIFAAIAAGARRIDSLALACIDAAADAAPGALMPCGACRQVMAEFAGADLIVHVDRAGSFTLGTLLPDAFRLEKKSSSANPRKA